MALPEQTSYALISSDVCNGRDFLIGGTHEDTDRRIENEAVVELILQSTRRIEHQRAPKTCDRRQRRNAGCADRRHGGEHGAAAIRPVGSKK